MSGRHINVSPKGMPSATFTIFDANHCAYVDCTGSGAETIAHIYEKGNARVTLCWCSFDSTPRILRFYCTGSVIEYEDPTFGKMLERMGHSRIEGARAIICLDVYKVGTSCGLSVPLLEAPQPFDEGMTSHDSSAPMPTTAARHFKQRDTLRRWAGVMEEKEKLPGYWALKNSRSLDGLPGARFARKGKSEYAIMAENICAVWTRALHETRGMSLGVLIGIALMLVTRTLLHAVA